MDNLEKGMLNKGIELYNKINDHIIGLTHDIVGLKGMSMDNITQRLINHLENFDDLEYVKMLGGNEEYLIERKALIAEYPAMLDLVSATVEKIMKSVPSVHTEPMLNEIREHPYYRQLRQYVAIIDLFL